MHSFVVAHRRWQLLWFAVTRHPTAERLAQPIVEAFPWTTAPAYMVRDNDGAYGQAFRRRVRAMGIRDRPISPRSPWQNPYAERLIGTLRRECLDHVLIFSALHLRRILTAYYHYWDADASIVGQGCSPRPNGPATWDYRRCADSVGLHHCYARFREGQVLRLITSPCLVGPCTGRSAFVEHLNDIAHPAHDHVAGEHRALGAVREGSCCC
jgi:hypothetical protein